MKKGNTALKKSGYTQLFKKIYQDSFTPPSKIEDIYVTAVL